MNKPSKEKKKVYSRPDALKRLKARRAALNAHNKARAFDQEDVVL